jgi:hypothetical protein
MGLVKSYFSSFFGAKKIKINRYFFCGAPDAPEDQTISLSAGFLANPDMALSHESIKREINIRLIYDVGVIKAKT